MIIPHLPALLFQYLALKYFYGKLFQQIYHHYHTVLSASESSFSSYTKVQAEEGLCNFSCYWSTIAIGNWTAHVAHIPMCGLFVHLEHVYLIAEEICEFSMHAEQTDSPHHRGRPWARLCSECGNGITDAERHTRPSAATFYCSGLQEGHWGPEVGRNWPQLDLPGNYYQFRCWWAFLERKTISSSPTPNSWDRRPASTWTWIIFRWALI